MPVFFKYMRFLRFYCELTLELGKIVRLGEDLAHYLRDVLRLPLRTQITLFNGLGGEFWGTIEKITRKEGVEVRIKGFSELERESPLKIHLGQVVSKREHMEYTLQKAVELGVQHLTPLISCRSEMNLEPKRLQNRLTRWRSIVESAAEQSGRNRLMTIGQLERLATFVKGRNGGFILDPCATVTLPSCKLIGPEVTLLVGPEGGFSPAEVEQAERAGFKKINLGPRILRTETAGTVAIAVMQALWGDLG